MRTSIVALIVLLAAAPALAAAPVMTRDGLGGLRVGMGIKEAERASGRKITLEKNSSDDLKACALARVSGLPDVWLLLEDYRIKVITANGRGYATADGVRAGTGEADLRRIFGKRIEFEARPYLDSPDAHNAIVKLGGGREFLFQTKDRKVESIAIGDLPAVEYMEGCS